MERQPKRKFKAPEEITKANLAKVLNKLKIRVAEREEIWLDALEYLIPLVKTEEQRLEKIDILVAADLADEVLKVYEDRWGK